MLDESEDSLKTWVHRFSEEDLPVLRQTIRELDAQRAIMDRADARDIARIVMRDPMMTLKVLSYIQRHRHENKLSTEITTIAHAIMMLGIEPFFAHFDELTPVEDLLKPQPQAMLGLLRTIRRAQRAAAYAADWAHMRHDIEPEEVRISALLHELAEILMWCFAPERPLEVETLQKQTPGLRTRTIQPAVYGFLLNDLTLELARDWDLPELLQNLMDDAHGDNPRVLNVILASNLARHSAQGWDDPAIPNDLAAVESLLVVTHEWLLTRLGLEQDARGIIRPLPPPPADTQ